MSRRFPIASSLVCGAALLLAGCGSSSSGLKLTAYLVHGSEETGFSTQGAPSVMKRLNSYLTSEYGGDSDPIKLKAEGFKEFATVGTGGPEGRQGGSSALELGSSSAAIHDQAAALASARQGQAGAKLVPFTVPGVPGSSGVHALGSQATSNVYWHEGTCSLWVGDFGSSAPVIAAARAIWAATHARKGACAT